MSLERDAPDLTGEVIDGRYRVEYELGRGGMGRVWSVQHVESLARFALKTLELGEEGVSRDRLSREARAASALRTRHVARVFDARTDYVHEGRPLPYLVMERLEGLTLEQWLGTRGGLVPAQVLWVMGQVARALTLAHDQGIVHRDLKPSNIFLSVDEEGAPLVKLCDFGIAKFTSLAAAALLTEGGGTSSKEVLGTPLYLAPELLRGGDRATPATDQWALALTVFKALSAREYFANAATGPELVLRIAQDPLIPPSELVAGLPPALDGWFSTSCARNPAERFESVQAQIEALAEAVGSPVPTPVPITRSSAVRRTAPARAKNPNADAPPPRRGARRVALFATLAWAGFGTLFLLLAEARPGSGSAPTSSPRFGTEHAPVVATAAPVEAPRATSLAAPETPEAASSPPRVGADASSKRLEAPPKKRNAPRAALAPARATESAAPNDLTSGASCRRSSECASGLCVAERCR